MEKLFIIKIGGNVIDNKDSLRSFLKDFSQVKGKKILVHGGGKIATSVGEKLGIQSKYIEGRRITDNETIDLVTMVYGGLVNKRIAALLQSFHCNAIGICGADANLIPAKKRPVKDIDYGWVGDINAQQIDPEKWKLFLDNGMVPVIAPLTHDGRGCMLNTNADTIASALSVSLAKNYYVKLIYCFEKDGVLADVATESSVIKSLTAVAYHQLKEKDKLFAGILPKIDNSFDAVNNGVGEVVIGNSSKLSLIINGKSGTKISLQ
ncbi:MAG: acetylglutamate kinase [Ginsengibacter sp.]